MKKTIALFVVLSWVLPVATAPAFAAMVRVANDIKTQDVGNKYCPVTGEAVSGTDFVIYNGKRYGLCCSVCGKQFLSDPAKYIAKMEKQETPGGTSNGAEGKKTS